MASIRVTIHGRGYNIACEDGQEAQLEALANQVNDRLKALQGAVSVPLSEGMLFVMSMIAMQDEMNELREQLEQSAYAPPADETAKTAGDDVASGRYSDAQVAQMLNVISERLEALAGEVSAGSVKDGAGVKAGAEA